MTTTPSDSTYLVVAHSARMLAQSAARAGHPVCSLDLFNDSDTSRYTRASEAVAASGAESPGFDHADLLRRANRLCPPAACRGLVYGAGFEDDTDLLAALARGRPLLGNPPSLVRRLKDPVEFFGLLDRLSIPHPATSIASPVDPRGWLYKRRGGTGGCHVVDAASPGAAPPPGDGYFQRRGAGRSLSMLLLADGRDLVVIGFSEQLTARVAPHRYAYRGAVGPVALDAVVAARLRRAATAIVRATQLVGCNSIDFLLKDRQPLVLEVNPRPSATLDLYDADWPAGLFEAHLQACAGRLPAAAPALRKPGGRSAPVTLRGHAIVYNGSLRAVAAPDRLPPWCTDVPRAGSTIPAGAPICTVHAAAASLDAVRRQLRRRGARVRQDFERQEMRSEETFDGSVSDSRHGRCRAAERQTEREPAGGAAGRVDAGAGRRAADRR